nr:hypothetical protein CFP56_48178 [Quercus suber]
MGCTWVSSNTSSPCLGIQSLKKSKEFLLLRKCLESSSVMVLKIDLEKAFDRLEWSFVREVLFHFSFPPNLIALIMDCISSSTVSSSSMEANLTLSTPPTRLGKEIQSLLTSLSSALSTSDYSSMKRSLSRPGKQSKHLELALFSHFFFH